MTMGIGTGALVAGVFGMNVGLSQNSEIAYPYLICFSS